MRIIGVDPGGRESGLVVRERDGTCLEAVLVLRDDGADIQEYVTDFAASLIGLVDEYDVDAVAVEGYKPPNPHMGMINVAGLLDACAVCGAALAAPIRVVTYLVTPGGHGAAPLQAYPSQLIGKREKKGTGLLRHCRSAWDIAGIGMVMHINTSA